ncbi:hypothetical protein CUJ84_Chr001835 [Rhizobium leguminosarum]|uniref:Uncharacterized protein n=1 Tax=Rhizobium leguminosarum TaxID=384 RepID=A0A2K9Z1V4_RHILE|nr:hypothetical protein CUJ84_Chr001835 [Rhizobium leguminosarum]
MKAGGSKDPPKLTETGKGRSRLIEVRRPCLFQGEGIRLFAREVSLWRVFITLSYIQVHFVPQSGAEPRFTAHRMNRQEEANERDYGCNGEGTARKDRRRHDGLQEGSC